MTGGQSAPSGAFSRLASDRPIPIAWATVSDYAPSAAFFDLDRTPIRGSANFPLALAAFRAGFVPKRQLLKDNADRQLRDVALDRGWRTVETRDDDDTARVADTAQDLAKRSDPSSGR